MSLYFARPFEKKSTKSTTACPSQRQGRTQTNLVGVRPTASVIDGLVNMLTKKGKQNLAEKIAAHSATFIKIIDKNPGTGVIYHAIRNVKPLIEVKNQMRQRRQKQKPVPILPHRSYQLAIRWILEGAKLRSERTMALRLYRELIDAYNGKGYAIKKKIEWHSRACSGPLDARPRKS